MSRRLGTKGGTPVKCSLCGVPSGTKIANPFFHGKIEGITLQKVGMRDGYGIYRCQNCYVG